MEEEITGLSKYVISITERRNELIKDLQKKFGLPPLPAQETVFGLEKSVLEMITAPLSLIPLPAGIPTPEKILPKPEKVLPKPPAKEEAVGVIADKGLPQLR